MMHDSDIDTCLPGDVEQHCDDLISDRATMSELATASFIGVKRKRVDQAVGSSCGSVSSPSVREPSPAQVSFEIEPEAVQSRLLAANALTRMGTMTGRAMEAFNKSLKHRTLDCETILFLRVPVKS